MEILSHISIEEVTLTRKKPVRIPICLYFWFIDFSSYVFKPYTKGTGKGEKEKNPLNAFFRHEGLDSDERPMPLILKKNKEKCFFELLEILGRGKIDKLNNEVSLLSEGILHIGWGKSH